MDILEKPAGGNLTADPRFPSARQYFTAHSGKLQTKTDVVAEAANRLLFSATGMLMINQLRKSWKIPDRAVLARERMLPPVGDIRNGLALDANGDLIGFSFLPMNNQRIGSPIRSHVELARLDTGNMNPGWQDLAVEKRRDRIRR